MKESSFCFATATLLRARRKTTPTSACTGHGEKTRRNRTRPTLGYQRRCTRQDFNEPWLEIGFRTDWHGSGGRVRDESLACKGDATRIRSGLWLFYDQWPHAAPRGANPREAGRTSSIPCFEWKRYRDSQSCPAGPFFSCSRLGRQSRPESRERSRTLVGYGGASFRDCADEPPRRLDHGRSSG